MVEQNVWDILITGGVLAGIGVLIASRVTGMTVKEMIIYIKEIMGEKQEEVVDNALVFAE